MVVQLLDLSGVGGQQALAHVLLGPTVYVVGVEADCDWELVCYDRSSCRLRHYLVLVLRSQHVTLLDLKM